MNLSLKNLSKTPFMTSLGSLLKPSTFSYSSHNTNFEVQWHILKQSALWLIHSTPIIFLLNAIQFVKMVQCCQVLSFLLTLNTNFST